MKLGWYHYEMPADDPIARGYYTTAHALRFGLEAAGVEIIDIGPRNARKKHLARTGLDKVVHFCPPHRYDHLQSFENYLFTMWEAPIMPVVQVGRDGREYSMHAKLRAAEHVIVPSKFIQSVFRKEANVGSTVVPLGVGPEFRGLDPTRRILRGAGSEKLRFLWVGTPQPRKGFHLIPQAWGMVFNDKPASRDVQLYIKGIAPNKAQQGLKDHYGDGRFIEDSRDLEVEELAALYQSADVFLFPSMGEGFGLPPLEAMAAGCLTVAPETGGMTEFINCNTAVVLPKDQMQDIRYGGMEWRERQPTVGNLARAIDVCYRQWGLHGTEAVRQNGTRVARRFTWEKTIEGLLQIVGGQNEGLIQRAS